MTKWVSFLTWRKCRMLKNGFAKLTIVIMILWSITWWKDIVNWAYPLWILSIDGNNFKFGRSNFWDVALNVTLRWVSHPNKLRIDNHPKRSTENQVNQSKQLFNIIREMSRKVKETRQKKKRHNLARVYDCCDCLNIHYSSWYRSNDFEKKAKDWKMWLNSWQKNDDTFHIYLGENTVLNSSSLSNEGKRQEKTKKNPTLIATNTKFYLTNSMLSPFNTETPNLIAETYVFFP